MTFKANDATTVPIIGKDDAEFLVDPYDTLDVMKVAEKQPEEVEELRKILGKIIGVDAGEIKKESAWDFKEYICQSCQKLNEDRKKKVEQIVYSPQAIQESPTISGNGTNEQKTPGSETLDGSETSRETPMRI